MSYRMAEKAPVLEGYPWVIAVAADLWDGLNGEPVPQAATSLANS
jgi:hypothetical protein